MACKRYLKGEKHEKDYVDAFGFYAFCKLMLV